MVLGSQGPGRVGRRRFLLTSRPLGGSSSFWRPADSVGSFRQAPAAGSAKSRPCRAVTSAPRSRRRGLGTSSRGDIRRRPSLGTSSRGGNRPRLGSPKSGYLVARWYPRRGRVGQVRAPRRAVPVIGVTNGGHRGKRRRQRRSRAGRGSVAGAGASRERRGRGRVAGASRARERRGRRSRPGGAVNAASPAISPGRAALTASFAVNAAIARPERGRAALTSPGTQGARGDPAADARRRRNMPSTPVG